MQKPIAEIIKLHYQTIQTSNGPMKVYSSRRPSITSEHPILGTSTLTKWTPGQVATSSTIYTEWLTNSKTEQEIALWLEHFGNECYAVFFEDGTYELATVDELTELDVPQEYQHLYAS